jgi:hypothetical protein
MIIAHHWSLSSKNLTKKGGAWGVLFLSATLRIGSLEGSDLAYFFRVPS